MKKLLALFLLLATPAFGQGAGTLQNHAIPIGKGTSVRGYTALPPGAVANAPLLNTPNADPFWASVPALNLIAGTGISIVVVGTDATISATGGGGGAGPCAVNTLMTGAGIGVTPICAATLPTINVPAFTGGDVTSAGSSLVLSVANNAITNAKLATMATRTVKANITGGTAVPTDVGIATNSDFLAGTTDKFVQSGTLWQAETTTTFGTTTTFDFSTFKNTTVTLTGNITTMTLSNVTIGKAGSITFIQDGTGSRTTVWNSIFKFASGAAPVLTTTAGAVDILSYSCRTATFCQAALMNDVK